MNEFYIQSLYNELGILKKRTTKLAVALYLIPLLYFLLLDNVNIGLSLGSFSVQTNNKLLIFIPLIYIGLYYYLFFTGEKSVEVTMKLEAMCDNERATQDWLSTIQPHYALGELIFMLTKSHFSTIFMLVPLVFFIVILPSLFLFYSIYELAILTINEGIILNWVLLVLTLWLMVVILYFVFNRPDLATMFEKRKKLLENYKAKSNS